MFFFSLSSVKEQKCTIVEGALFSDLAAVVISRLVPRSHYNRWQLGNWKCYHDWFKQINDSFNAPDGAKKEMAKHIDSWLVDRAKEFSKVKVGDEKKPAGAVAVKKGGYHVQ